MWKGVIERAIHANPTFMVEYYSVSNYTDKRDPLRRTPIRGVKYFTHMSQVLTFLDGPERPFDVRCWKRDRPGREMLVLESTKRRT